MNRSFILASPDFGGDLALRTIVEADCEDLRQWKNANRFSFFHQEIITPQQQREWFAGYLARDDDYMFILSVRDRAIGCMGFRLLDDHADIYNVILADALLGGKGWMSQALRLMCSYILSDFTRDIRAKVLRSNPALDWYLKNGFRRRAEHETYFEIELDADQFQICSFQIAR